MSQRAQDLSPEIATWDQRIELLLRHEVPLMFSREHAPALIVWLQFTLDVPKLGPYQTATWVPLEPPLGQISQDGLLERGP